MFWSDCWPSDTRTSIYSHQVKKNKMVTWSFQFGFVVNILSVIIKGIWHIPALTIKQVFPPSKVDITMKNYDYFKNTQFCQQIKKVNDPCEVKQKALTYDCWLLYAHSCTQLITCKRINGVVYFGCRLYSIFPSLVSDRYKVWHSRSLRASYMHALQTRGFGQFPKWEAYQCRDR